MAVIEEEVWTTLQYAIAGAKVGKKTATTCLGSAAQDGSNVVLPVRLSPSCLVRRHDMHYRTCS
jgi:hypothetical protein